MKFVVLALLAVAVAADHLEDRRKMAEYVNSVQSEWVADANNWVAELAPEQARGLLGINMNTREKMPPRTFLPEKLVNAPTAFDSRENWPNCTTMKEIRDQATCGSCWAFGSVETMSDRECVTNGRIVRISAEDVNSCNTLGCGGCNGGQESCAFRYWVKVGVVTEDCYPYSIPSCDHHIPNSTNPCGDTWPTPKCKKECQKSFSGTWAADKHFGAESYGVYGEAEMMAELQENGPFDVAFNVYTDFMSYKSGIYHHTTGYMEGGHAVKVVGWGVENNVKFWIVANSWNPHWGEKGFFRIRKGNNECSFESQGVAGIPKKI